MRSAYIHTSSVEQAAARAMAREVFLPARQVFRLENLLPGTVLTTLEGRLWVTCQDDRRDYLLQPGSSLAIPGSGVVLVEGLPAGRMRISLPVDRSTE